MKNYFLLIMILNFNLSFSRNSLGETLYFKVTEDSVSNKKFTFDNLTVLLNDTIKNNIVIDTDSLVKINFSGPEFFNLTFYIQYNVDNLYFEKEILRLTTNDTIDKCEICEINKSSSFEEFKNRKRIIVKNEIVGEVNLLGVINYVLIFDEITNRLIRFSFLDIYLNNDLKTDIHFNIINSLEFEDVKKNKKCYFFNRQANRKRNAKN